MVGFDSVGLRTKLEACSLSSVVLSVCSTLTPWQSHQISSRILGTICSHRGEMVLKGQDVGKELGQNSNPHCMKVPGVTCKVLPL